MQIKFRLKDRKHLLLGVAFSKRKFSGADQNNIGQIDFPTVVLDGSSGDRTLMIVNRRTQKDQSYDYLILIQEVASGDIGVIDPEIENEA